MNLMGICEETTTGVARLKKKYQNNQLRYPAVAINDAKSKYLFDNRYGTGQSTWASIMHLTSLHYILSSDNLENKVYQVPDEIDEMIVREKLRVEGIEINGEV